MKNAIVTLTRGYDTLDKYESLIQRNNSISETVNLSNNVQFENIIFHEGNISKAHQDYIQSKTKLSLKFIDVKSSGNYSAFDDKKNQINLELCPPTELSNRFELGYKHMCHFWAIDLLEYLSDYKYIVRIDEDVIVKSFHPSLMETIISNEIKFAVPYVCPFLDHPDVIVGLEKLFNRFCVENELIPKTKFENVYAPNTNFMILDLEYFRKHDLVQRFLKDVDESHGIYSNRWGDATTWGIIVCIIMDEPFYVLDMVEYFHGSHGHHVNEKGVEYVRSSSGF